MTLPKLTLAEFARAARQEGESVREVAGYPWREVRPFFFRPLLTHQELAPADTRAPFRARFGGYQHATPAGAPANSTMSFLIFPDARDYSLAKLHPTRRWEVRTAAKRFQVRPFSDCTEFKRTAHDVYVSFFNRTKYGYIRSRLHKEVFDRWADAVFSSSALLALGAFAGDELAAVSLSRCVGGTLRYSTYFARLEAMRSHVSSLMLHSIRTAAAESGDIDQIFVGMPKSSPEHRSVDDFYLHRGCIVQTRPAWLRLNPLVGWLLARLNPRAAAQLRGEPSIGA